MKLLFSALTLLATCVAAGAWGQNNYLSAYGGGGSGGRYLSAYGGGGSSGDYRQALGRYSGGSGSYSGNASNGYTGAGGGKFGHFQGSGNRNAHGGFSGQFVGNFNAQWHNLGWNNGLGLNGRQGSAAEGAPCGNFLRAAANCRQTTMAWDPSFVKQRGW